VDRFFRFDFGCGCGTQPEKPQQLKYMTWHPGISSDSIWMRFNSAMNDVDSTSFHSVVGIATANWTEFTIPIMNDVDPM